MSSVVVVSAVSVVVSRDVLLVVRVRVVVRGREHPAFALLVGVVGRGDVIRLLREQREGTACQWRSAREYFSKVMGDRPRAWIVGWGSCTRLAESKGPKGRGGACVGCSRCELGRSAVGEARMSRRMERGQQLQTHSEERRKDVKD